jgi:hypothetical protein
MSDKPEQIFREVVHGGGGGGGESNKLISSSVPVIIQHQTGFIIMGVILFVFIFLYWLNPPIVQCKKTENDLIRPPPNLYIISMISLLAGGMVFGMTFIKRK